MESGKILAPRKVFDEIMAGGDELSVWIDAFKGKTIDHSAVLAWSDIKIADPWLIAIAIVGGYSVVTFERTSASPKKPKIPDICDHFGVKHCNLFQMMRSLGFLLRS